MTAAVARIKEEMRNLPKQELDDLLRDIQAEYLFPPALEDDDESSVQAAWDEEINRRAQEVMDGTVELISGEDFHRDMDEFMKDLKLQRASAVA